MNINIENGDFSENGATIFWKGMNENDIVLTELIKGADVSKNKRISFYKLRPEFAIFGMEFSVSLTFKDSIIKRVELRSDEEFDRVSAGNFDSDQSCLNSIKDVFLRKIAELESIAPNIVSLPEIGFRHKWGKIVVIQNIKNFDCYILIEY